MFVFEGDILLAGEQHFMDGTVVAGQVDHEGAADAGRDPLLCV